MARWNRTLRPRAISAAVWVRARGRGTAGRSQAAVARVASRDLAVPFAAGNDGLGRRRGGRGPARSRSGRVRLGLAGQAFEETGTLLRASDLGSPAKCATARLARHRGVDAQPGVVSEGQQAGGAGGVAGLGDGVLDEAGVGLFSFADVEGRLGQHLDAEQGGAGSSLEVCRRCRWRARSLSMAGLRWGFRRGRGRCFCSATRRAMPAPASSRRASSSAREGLPSAVDFDASRRCRSSRRSFMSVRSRSPRGSRGRHGRPW